jgi:hypothetical protein
MTSQVLSQRWNPQFEDWGSNYVLLIQSYLILHGSMINEYRAMVEWLAGENRRNSEENSLQCYFVRYESREEFRDWTRGTAARIQRLMALVMAWSDRRGRDSSVNRATCWTAGIRFPAGSRFSLLRNVHFDYGAHQASCQRGTGDCFLAGKAARTWSSI